MQIVDACELKAHADHHRHRQNCRDQHGAAFRGQILFAKRLRRALKWAAGRLAGVQPVAGSSNPLGQRLHRYRTAQGGDRGAVQRQLHFRINDARLVAQHLLHAASAGGTRHSFDGEIALFGGHLVARSRDHLRELASVGGLAVDGNGRPLQRQIHIHGQNARRLAQRLVQPRHAGGAGHAGDGEIEFDWRVRHSEAGSNRWLQGGVRY